ncbi:hypothetical protein [Clostridium brassicae]|uniref:Uncharacterized protein n=1 Tax=Clostridium brassicae TaxID=2999072 RepID=A0ABT4DB88_9CLOT|nr:hypothetical protein [Clostridium brassicae]MCY6958294.1 hypothetical protein [Clostridium brassicae]
MKNLTKTEIRKNLQEIENILNNHNQWEIENGCVDYCFSLNKDNTIRFTISCEDEVYENYTIEEIENYDIKSILKSIINFLYENEINYRNNYIRKTKSFNNRKIKSLALWLERENNDRVNKINEELAERYKTTKKLESEIVKYKDYIRDLYSCLSVLCSDWRIEDIKEYVFNKLKEFNFENISISYIDNRLIVQKFDDKKVITNFEILIDNYSKKDEVFSKAKRELEAAC